MTCEVVYLLSVGASLFDDVRDGGAVVHKKPEGLVSPPSGLILQCNASSLHFEPVDVLAFVLWFKPASYRMTFEFGSSAFY